MTQAAEQPRGRIYHRGAFNYSKLDGVNFSTLKELRRSPKRYRHSLDCPPEQTEPMAFGIASHVAILEPERFIRDYALWRAEGDDGKKQVRRGKKWDDFRAANDGKTIIRDTEYDEAIALSRAVRADPVAMGYLAMGKHEVAVTWTDEHTGMACKGRVDWLTNRGAIPILVDVKTTRNAAPWSFSKDTARLGYHLQLAFYADGLEAALGRAPDVRIVAVESEPPHDVVVYRVPSDVLEIGRDEYRQLLERLRDCRERDEWPGLADGLEQDLALPAWAAPDESDDLSDLKGW